MSSDIQDSDLSLTEHRNQHKDYHYSVLHRKDFLSYSSYSESLVMELCDYFTNFVFSIVPFCNIQPVIIIM